MDTVEKWVIDGIEYDVVVPSCPSFDASTHDAYLPGMPYRDGDLWRVNWVIEAKTPEAIEASKKEVRDERSRRLQACDWVVVFHTEKGTNIPLEWEMYRQQLRDITTQDGFPHNVTWPSPPA